MTDNSLIPISDAQAEMATEALKALRGVGSFLSEALGSTPADLVAYLGGDWLRVRRAENLARMMAEAKERLEQRGVHDAPPAPLSIALPLLQAAADEDRDELRSLWASLLAAAMDPARTQHFRQSFIETVRKMDPQDGPALQQVAMAQGNKMDRGKLSAVQKSTGLSLHELLLSFQHLSELKIVDDRPTDYLLTIYGMEFLKAVQD
ncbi:MAG: Abi-alpha family protein [Magnetospirillum sp.]|nr:Abi-alpha family protein [Magnetospirillum sp.]